MVRTLEQAEFFLNSAKARVAELQAERDALVNKAHTITAADFRIIVESDESCASTFEDIWGDATQEDIDDKDSVYNDWLDAYNNGRGIYGFWVRLEQRDAASGEYECIDSCSGFYSLYDWPEQNTLDQMMQHMRANVPADINFADIEGAQ